MSNNIAKASVVIQGVRPLFWHHFGPDALPLEKRERTGVAGNDPHEWKRTVLITKERQLYITSEYIFGCLRDGAKYTKKGKGSIQPIIVATLQIQTERVLINRFLPEEGRLTTDPEEQVYLDVRSVRNPSTKARNVRYRIAASPGWKAEFEIIWDVTMISREQMKAVTIDAGRFVGIGNGRSIGMGRFDLLNFEIEALGYAKTSTA